MSTPCTMKQMTIMEPGTADVPIFDNGPVPRPDPGEVLIRVAAAGVTRPDVTQRESNFSPPSGASPIPGLEVAGENIAVGEGVRKNFLGDNVCALVSGGGYAQYCNAPMPQLLPCLVSD